MKAVIDAETAPGTKKQRTSVEGDGYFEVINYELLSSILFCILIEPDSGIDATTITTSTQASTATSSSGNIRPSRTAKTVASGNLVSFFWNSQFFYR